LEFWVLGPIEVTTDGEAVALGGPQLRRLLAFLVLRAGTPASSDALAEALWGDDAPPDGRGALRAYVTRLRRALSDDGQLIVTESGGYRLDLAGHLLDVREVELLIARARAAPDPATKADLLSHALATWRGEPFAELTGSDLADGERWRLGELHRAALEELYEAKLDLGVAREIVPELERAIREVPFSEPLQRVRALALYRSGRQAEAMRALHEFGRWLTEETGLLPSVELRELAAAIASDDPALRVADPDRRLRSYRLVERISESPHAVVWRGFQPSVQRAVAIKSIPLSLSAEPTFVRRFETEASLVAGLEHPHVVPVYDFWRDADGAHLVLRWMSGGTLADHLDEGPLQRERVADLVAEVGSALVAAHASGISHGDVSSTNVLVDGAGHFYLGDFGIGEVDASHDRQRRDVAQFVALVSRILDGQKGPSTWARNAGRVLGAWSEDPSTTEQLVHDLAVSLGRSPGSLPRGSAESGRNPFKGLRPFGEADAADFFGRDHLVERLLTHLQRPGPVGQFLAVVGPSGSGKSSLVRAGLLPALRAGRVDGSAQWFATSMVPGHHPFEELEAALARIAVRPLSTADLAWRETSTSLVRAVKKVLPDDRSEVVLVVDQFEEIFSVSGEAEASTFVDAVVGAVTDERSRVRVVATLRADWLDRPLAHPELGVLFESSTMPIPMMSGDELEAAVVGPLARLGLEAEAGLPARIVGDVVNRSGSLPLMQYALTELFERRRSGLLTLSSYDELGGVAGAVAARAEQLIGSEDVDVARRVFARLVRLGDGPEATRRRAALSEYAGDTDALGVVERFAAARLLTYDRDSATREATVEIAHEALLAAWPRLREWVRDDGEDLRLGRQLTGAAERWETSGRDDADLLSGVRLDAACALATRRPNLLSALESDLLDRSNSRRTQIRERERRVNRRLRSLLVVVGVVAAVALVAGVAAFAQRSRADDRAREAETERLGGSAAAILRTDRRAGLLAAAEAFRRNQVPTNLDALQSVLTETETFLGYFGSDRAYESVEGLSGGRIAAVRADGIDVYDSASHERLAEIGTPPDLVTDGFGGVVSSDDGTILYLLNWNGVLLAVDFDEETVRKLATPGAGIGLTARDGLAVVGRFDGAVVAVELSTGAQAWSHLAAHPETSYVDAGFEREDLDPQVRATEEIAFAGGVTSVAALPGDEFLTTRGPVARRWSRSGKLLDTIRMTDSAGQPFGAGIAFSVAGQRYLTDLVNIAPIDSRGRLGALVKIPNGRGPNDTNTIAKALAATTDGRAVTLATDGTWYLFDPSDGAVVDHGVDSGLSGATDIAFDRATGTVVIASSEGLGSWSLQGNGLIERILPANGAAELGVSRDGRMASATGVTNHLWRIEPEGLSELSLPDGVDFIGFARDRPELYFWSGHGRTSSAVDERTLDVLRTYGDVGAGRARSPDGRLEAVGRFLVDRPDGLSLWHVGIFDTTTGRQVGSDLTELWEIGRRVSAENLLLRFGNAALVALAFTPDGSHLLGSVFGEVVSWDTTTWKATNLGQYGVRDMVFHPTTGELITSGPDGVISVRDPVTLSEHRRLIGAVDSDERFGGGLVFDKSGRWLLSTIDRTPRLFDYDTGEQVGRGFVNDLGGAAQANSGEQLWGSHGPPGAMPRSGPSSRIAGTTSPAGQRAATLPRTSGPSTEPETKSSR
jgi:DNA-binding SARP family transcriptional activator/WD40 repeat protein